MASKQRRYFPGSFKRQAVERVSTSSLPICRLAEELGVHETVLRRWITRFAEPGTGRRPVTQAQGPSPADLAAENARLGASTASVQSPDCDADCADDREDQAGAFYRRESATPNWMSMPWRRKTQNNPPPKNPVRFIHAQFRSVA